MINGIGVTNFRSFKKSTLVDLKPITVFVGKNSSGKSSLLRTFPLFRQSVEENTTGPILWYGRYVDFGDFDEIKSNGSESNNINFCFNITLTEQTQSRYSPYYRYWNIPTAGMDLSVNLTVYSKDRKTKAREITITHPDFSISLTIDDNENAKLAINSGDISLEKDGLIVRNLGQFIPHVIQKRSKEDQVLNTNKRYLYGPNLDRALEIFFLESATKVIQNHFHSKTDIERITHSLSRIPFLPFKNTKSMLESIFKEQKTFIKHFNQDGETITKNVYPYIIGFSINLFFELINRTLSEVFNKVKYIAPLRATSERFYRFQDLQINEIDHTGSNLAMLLNSLKPFEKTKFEEWTKENFGFIVKVKQVGAHFAVTISTNNKEEFNISDMGFGYSQVLPIVTAIWLETERRTNNFPRTPITFIIEQPELHLHPSYQYNLAKTFAKVISKSKKSNLDLKIIFETHSQNMIEALGECVEDDEIDVNSEDISILVFDKNDDNSTKVTKSYFDSNGYLENWPIGFFSGQ
jgi:AAA15 family ATPase/GTPase